MRSILTWASPASRKPSVTAAAVETSMTLPWMNGPRSTILTITDRPVKIEDPDPRSHRQAAMRRGQSSARWNDASPSSVAEASQPIPRATTQKTKSVRIRG